MRKLLTAHVAAWVTAVAIALVAVLLNGGLTLQSALLIAALGGGYWLAFVYNDFHDADIDVLQPAKAGHNYFVSATQRRQKSRMFLLAVIVAPLGVVGLGQFGWRGVLVMAVSLVVMWAYSAPPLRLKYRPGADILVHACFVEVYPFVVVMFLLGASWDLLDVAILTVLFLGSISAQLEQQLRDFEVDKYEGKTFAIVIGKRPAYWIMLAATAAIVIAGLFLAASGDVPLYIYPFAAITLPALGHRFLRGQGRAQSPRLIGYSAVVALVYVAGLLAYLTWHSGSASFTLP